VPVFDLDMHVWPGQRPEVVASAVGRAARRAAGDARAVGGVRVVAYGPYTLRITLAVAPNVQARVRRAVAESIRRLRCGEPGRTTPTHARRRG
jgi:hypothetical protein